MKTILALAACLALMSLPLSAQQNTNAPTASEAEGGTNEVDIKELMNLPQFTNDTGMVMVKVSNALWAGAYEVTQEEYQKIAGSNPSGFPGARHPVDSVTWNEAMSFCAKLTEAEEKSKRLPEGFAYTLPTQAQWDSLAAGAELKDAITSSGTRRSGTSPVGTLGATGPGLYDIRGNVREWSLDPADRPFRVALGASWDTWIEINLRPVFRWFEQPDNRRDKIGFRCVLAPQG